MYDLSIYAYYAVLLALALGLTAIANHVHKAVITTEQRLKTIISKLFDSQSFFENPPENTFPQAKAD